MDEEVLKKALIKKALGGKANEIVEEYASDKDGNVVLQRRKVTTKVNLPDVSALKMLMEEKSDLDVEHLTDVELREEKARLLNLLKEKENENRKNQPPN